MTNLDIQSAYLGLDPVEKIYLGSDIVFESGGTHPEPVYSAMPLTFEIISGGTITWKSQTNFLYPAPSRTIEYSINGAAWSSITSDSGGVSFNVATGDIVRFKGNNLSYGGSQNTAGNQLIVDGVFKVYGNVYSLCAEDYLSFSGQGSVAHLFQGNTGLTEVTEIAFGRNYNLSFPGYGLKELFRGCQNLNYVKCLANMTLTQSVIKDWLTETSAQGTLVKHPNASYGVVPSGWTVVDAVV